MVVMAEDAIVAGATAGAGSWGGKSIKVRVRVRVRVVSSVLSSWRAFHCREGEREKEGKLGVGNREEIGRAHV